MFVSFSIIFLRRRLTRVHWLGIITVVDGLIVVGVSDLLFSKDSEGDHTNAQKALGILLILLGMIFTSLQVQINIKIIKYIFHMLFCSGCI